MNYVDEMIAQALKADIEAEISECSNLPRHIFSLRFRRKMRKVIYAGGVPYQRPERVPLRKSIAIAFVVIIFMAFVTGATKMIYKLWKNYRFHENGDYTCIALIDIEGAPETIIEKYRLGINLDNYTENLLLDNEYDYWVEYFEIDGDRSIGFSQSIKDNYQGGGHQLYTKDAMVKPTELEIRGTKYIFFQTKYGDMALIWDNGDYVIEVGTTGFSKYELILMAESVHKVE